MAGAEWRAFVGASPVGVPGGSHSVVLEFRAAPREHSPVTHRVMERKQSLRAIDSNIVEAPGTIVEATNR